MTEEHRNRLYYINRKDMESEEDLYSRRWQQNFEARHMCREWARNIATLSMSATKFVLHDVVAYISYFQGALYFLNFLPRPIWWQK